MCCYYREQIPTDLYQVLPKTCPDFTFETCGVVGNSGILLHDTLGEHIDANEMVYRYEYTTRCEGC